MRCDFSKEKLLEYFYAEVSDDEKSQIESHVAECPACQTELAQLGQTAGVLRRWPDEEPNLNIHFVQQKSSPWNWASSIRQKSWPKFAFGFAAGLATVLVILSLVNFDASYSDGNINVKFNLFRNMPPPPPTDPLDRAVTRREFNAWQQTSYELMQSMIDNAGSQQRYEQRLLLSQFARDLDLKRQQDLQRVGQGLEVLQLVNDDKFRRTSAALQKLMYAAYFQNSDTNRIENK